MRLATLGSIRLPAHSVRLMSRLLEEQGCDPARALRFALIPPAVVADPAATISGLQELAFQRAFVRLTPERPDLWIELGARYRLLSHAHPDYGLLMSTAPSFDAAMRVGLHYGDLYYMLAHAEGIEQEGRLVGFRSLANEMPEDLRRFSTLRDVAVNCAVTADLWGGPFPFDRVELPLPASDLAHVRRFLPETEVVAGTQFSCWRWSVRSDLRRPPQSDAMLHEVYRRSCDRLLTEAHRAGDIVDRVGALLAATRGRLSVEEAARQLGLSARTLQRRLGARGLSYRDLATLRRHQDACRLLVETGAPVASIAEEVGYDNVSSFNVAFRRHAGTSPGKYRRALLRGESIEQLK